MQDVESPRVPDDQTYVVDRYKTQVVSQMGARKRRDGSLDDPNKNAQN